MERMRKIFLVLGILLIVVGAVRIFYGIYTRVETPEAVAKRELANLAQDYYENYYYDKIDDPTNTLAEFAETGLPTVYLRTLLAFDNERHAESAQLFRAADYVCDTNSTGAKIFPEEPYGRTDYRVEYKYSCEEV